MQQGWSLFWCHNVDRIPWCSQANVVLVTSIINLPGSMLFEPFVDPFLYHFPLYSNMTRRAPSPYVPSLSKVGVQARILWVKHGHLLEIFLKRNKSNLAGPLKSWKSGMGRQNRPWPSEPGWVSVLVKYEAHVWDGHLKERPNRAPSGFDDHH